MFSACVHSPSPTINDKFVSSIVPNAVLISGPITDLSKHIALLLGEAVSGRPVWIIINSPGGGTRPGMEFVKMMEEIKKDQEINCIVTDEAASMAFVIFSHCTNRYVYSNSQLMFHEVALFINEPMRIPMSVLRELAEDVDGSEKAMNQSIEELKFPKYVKSYYIMNSIEWSAKDYIDSYGTHWMQLIEE